MNALPRRKTVRMVGTMRGRAYELCEVVTDERVKDFYKSTTEVLHGTWEVIEVVGGHPARITFQEVIAECGTSNIER